MGSVSGVRVNGVSQLSGSELLGQSELLGSVSMVRLTGVRVSRVSQWGQGCWGQ